VRVALLSDIHSNSHALEAVFDHSAGQGIDRYGCLGDIVGYNAHPNRCVTLLQKHGVAAVQGNHDWAATDGTTEGFNPYAVAGVEHSRKVLQGSAKDWLKALPRAHTLDLAGVRVALFHGSPRDPLFEYVFPTTDGRALKEMAKAAGAPDVIALGHTHLPMRRDEGALWVNPGSVGQPRDGDARSSYAVLDTGSKHVAFHRVAYDVDAAVRDVLAAGLPEFLAQRLLRGL
jgi:putative phosphoesterase